MHLPLLAYLAGLSGGVPCTSGLLRWRSLSSDLRILAVLFTVNFVAMIVQIALSRKGVNNLWISHFYSLIEFLCLTWVFAEWQVTGWKRKLLHHSVLGYIIFWVLSKLFLEDLTRQPYYTVFLSKIFFTAWSIQLLHLISGETKAQLFSLPRFWIVSANLISSSGSLMFYSLRTTIDKLPLEGLVIAYGIHWIIMILSNAVFAAGFLCKARPRNSGGQLELAQ